MSLPFQQETYSVSALCEEIRSLLAEAYASVWVTGELQRLRTSQRGHVYFELIEKGGSDEIVAKVDAVVWRQQAAQVQGMLRQEGQRLEEGQQIRCRGGVDFYPPFGRLQLVVREIDPLFTLGLLEKRRRETLAALSATGLMERNRQLSMPRLPLRLALITSEGSAAYHDFLSTLRESGYGFRLLFIHSAVQGRDAERELVSALAALAGLEIDCAALIRGGGSRTDLAVFDSRRVAEAVALAPVPIITGLGHEIDQSIADLVAHTAAKTPTKAAEHLVERVAASDRELAEVRRSLRRLGPEMLRRGREALGRAERGLRLAGFRLGAERSLLSDLGGRLARGAARAVGEQRRRSARVSRGLALAAGRSLKLAGGRPLERAGRLAAAASSRLREASILLEGRGRLAAQLGPRRTLERGFSITRGPEGGVLRHPAAVAGGDAITTELAGGVLRSRVEER